MRARYFDVEVGMRLLKESTGRGLRTDVTERKIRDCLQKDHASTETEEWGNTFSRMSFWKRGHFTNLPRLRPVKQISFGANSLAIRKGWKTYEYHYDQLKGSIREKRKYKAYGAGIGGRIRQRTLVLRAPDEVFEFDVSTNFPDFENSKALERELHQHIEFE